MIIMEHEIQKKQANWKTCICLCYINEVSQSLSNLPFSVLSCKNLKKSLIAQFLIYVIILTPSSAQLTLRIIGNFLKITVNTLGY